MQVIPLLAVPNQTVSVIVSHQTCQLNIYQTFYGLFMDVYANGSLVIAGVICENLNRIIRSTYLGFVGDFFFLDTISDDDPDYTGLGDQFQLLYVEPSDPLPVLP